MTLYELLQEETLHDLQIINSHADLNRVVSSVESTETPDAPQFVASNSLVITTAMAFRDDQRGLVRMIRELSALPSAGLGIKLGRFVHELSPEVLETADELNFPIVLIPMQRTLGEVYHQVLSLLWGNENQELVGALNMQRKIHDSIIRETSLPRLMRLLGSILDKHCLILDRFGRISASFRTTEEEEVNVIVLMEQLDRDRMDSSVLTLPEDRPGTCRRMVFYPLKAMYLQTHFLVICDDDRSPVSSFTMEQIALSVSRLFYRESLSHLNEIIRKEEFLNLLVSADLPGAWTPSQLYSIGRNYQLKQSSYYNIVSCQFRRPTTHGFRTSQLTEAEEMYIHIYDYLSSRFREELGQDVLVFPDFKSWSYILLLQRNIPEPEALLTELTEQVRISCGRHLIWAFGRAVERITDCSESYLQATEVSGNVSPQAPGFIFRYETRNVMELMQSIPAVAIREACQSQLKDLAFPSDSINLELQHTLRTYLHLHCSIIDTARTMNVHKNTIRYRIRRCQDILGIDPNDPECSFQLQVCFSLMDQLK